MKIERIAQLLFYALLLILAFSLIRHNNAPIITPDIRNTFISFLLGLMIIFLVYYDMRKQETLIDLTIFT